MVPIPSLEEEDAKRPNRERESLVGERTRIAMIKLPTGDFISARRSALAIRPIIVIVSIWLSRECKAALPSNAMVTNGMGLIPLTGNGHHMTAWDHEG
jgi:hypothetical protein